MSVLLLIVWYQAFFVMGYYSYPCSSRRSLLATLDTTSLKIWDFDIDSLCFKTVAIDYLVYGTPVDIAFSPDMSKIYISQPQNSKIKVVDIETGATLNFFSLSVPSFSWIDISSDGTKIAIAGFGVSKIFYSISGTFFKDVLFLSCLPNYSFSQAYKVLFTADGNFLYMSYQCSSGPGIIEKVEIATGTSVKVISFPYNNYCNDFLITNDQKYFIASLFDNTIKVYDLNNDFATLNTFTGHTNYINSITVSPDYTLIASLSSDSTVKIWNLQSGALVTTLTMTISGGSLRFTEDGKYLITVAEHFATNTNHMKIWDVTSWACVKTINSIIINGEVIRDFEIGYTCADCAVSLGITCTGCYCNCDNPSYTSSSTFSECSANRIKISKCHNCQMLGYYNNGGTCSTCSTGCQQCTTASSCSICSANYFMTSGSSCVTACPSPTWGNLGTMTCDSACTNTNQFGDVLDNRICKACDSSCETCSGTATICNSCTLPLHLIGTSCIPGCPNTNEFADVSDNNICKPCDSSCLTCSGTATTCMSCDTPLYLSGTTCISACIDPKWGNNGTRTCDSACSNTNEYGDASDNRICKTCDPSCTTCQTTSSTCTSCTSPNYLSLSSCVPTCPSPSWGNNNTRTCDLTCTNPNEFGDASDNRICKVCDINCATCITIASSCTNCNSPLYLDGSSCVSACTLPTWGNNGTRQCAASCTNINEYGDTPDNRICKTCDVVCKTCSAISTSCTSCDSPNYLSLSTCVSACPTPNWGNNLTRTCDAACANINEYGDVSDNRICKTCDPSCGTCSGTALACTGCNLPLYLSSSSCVTACPLPKWGDNSTKTCASSCANSNEFGDISDNRICKTCDPTCNTCLMTSITCTSCSSPFYLSGSTCLSACIAPLWGNNNTWSCLASCSNVNEFGDILDNRICKTCDNNCATCSGTSTNCLTCNSPLYLLSSACALPCTSPYWGNNNTRTCDLTCTNLNEFGDASDNRICKVCDINCATCITTASSCTSCNSPLYLDGSSCVSACTLPTWGNNGTRQCAASCTNINEYGDTSDNRICKTGDVGCKTCSGTSTSCTSCDSPNYLSVSTCMSACPTPNWGNNSTRTCDATCANINEYGDVSDNRICKTCDPSCGTCSGTALACTSCNLPSYFSSSSCVTACPLPKWGNNGTKTCDSTCANLNEYGDVTDNRICKSCSIGCVTCSGAADICTQCPPNQLLFDSKVSGGTVYDKCIDKLFLKSPHPQYGNIGFYQSDIAVDASSGLAVALLCSVPCLTCYGKFSCLTCTSGLFLYDSGAFITCTKCDQIGFFQKDSYCFKYQGGCEIKNAEGNCQKCIQRMYLNYFVSIQGFTDLCKTCSQTGEYIDESYASDDRYGVCLTHSECSIVNCMKCSNLLKRCQICKAGYNLFISQGGNSDYCSVCLPDFYLRNNLTQINIDCLPKKIILGNLSSTKDPSNYRMSFDGDWEQYFKDLGSNLIIDITNFTNSEFSCSVKRDLSQNNSFFLVFSFNKSVIKDGTLKVKLKNIPAEDERSEIAIRVKEYRISMLPYLKCPENFTLSEYSVCEPLSIKYVNIEVRPTIDPLKYHLLFDQAVSDNLETNMRNNFKGFLKNTRLLAEGTYANFSITKIDDKTFEVFFQIDNSIANNIEFVLEIDSSNPNFKFTKSEISIPLPYYYHVSESDKKKFAQAGAASKSGSSTAENSMPFNNIFNPGSVFTVKGMVLIQTFQLLRFISIDYPPNVIELFDKKLSSYMYDFDIKMNSEDGYLEGHYYQFNFSKYILNNSGSYMLGGWVFLLIGVLAFNILPLAKLKFNSKAIQNVILQVENTVVWNFFLSHFLSRYMILVFTAAAGLRFNSINTAMGIFNLCFSLLSSLFIFTLPAFILFKLREMRNMKKRKVFSLNFSGFNKISGNFLKHFKKEKQKIGSPKMSMVHKNTLINLIYSPPKNGDLDSELDYLKKDIKNGSIVKSDSNNVSDDKDLQVEDLLYNDYKNITNIKTPRSSRKKKIKQEQKEDAEPKVQEELGSPDSTPGLITPHEKKRLSFSEIKTSKIRKNEENNNFIDSETELPSDFGLANPLPTLKLSPEQVNSEVKKISRTYSNFHVIHTQMPTPLSNSDKESFTAEIEKIKKRYKPIHEEFLDDHWVKYYFIIIELARQIVISFIILLGDTSPVEVSLLIMLINALFIILLIWVKPFKSLQTLILTLLTEFFLFIICLGTLGLAFLQDYLTKRKLPHDLDVYLKLGWIIVYAHIILIYFYLAVQITNYILLAKKIFEQIYSKLRHFTQSKRRS